MRKSSFIAAIIAGSVLVSVAQAQTFSTSALSPSPVPANGVISGSYPQGGAETTYYFAADLKAGDLATQISFMGRPGRDKSLEIALVDPTGKRAGGHYVMGSIDANQEQARVLPIDTTGRHVLRVITKGPETTTFRIELGGTALANVQKPTSADAPFSRSFLAPTPVPANGVITGMFPVSDDKVTTYYYFATNLKAGQLLSQLSFAGRENSRFMVDRMAEFTVLNATGRAVGGFYIMSGLEANQEAHRSIAIDNSDAYVLRIGVKGPDNTGFKLQLGGDAVAAR
jgi:hypothetical protein